MSAADEGIQMRSVEPIDGETLQRASDKLLLLPNNWPTLKPEPVYAESTESLRKLLVKKGIGVETLTPVTPHTHLRQERALDWVSPTLLVSSLLMTQNPAAVTIALNVISDYVTEILRGVKSDPRVRLTIVRSETTRRTAQKISYEGPVSGLHELVKVLIRRPPED